VAPFGFSGFEIAFGLLNKHVIGQKTQGGTVTLEHVLRLLTSAPAALMAGALGNQEQPIPQLGDAALDAFQPRSIPVSLGRIAEGLPADLTLLDLDTSWAIDPERFVSRGRNTPFVGWEARGRPVFTLCRGEITLNTAKGAS
jgi:dihydroorotase